MQSRNRYHSRTALCKVRIQTWLRNSRMVSVRDFVNFNDEVDALRKVGVICAKLEWFGETACMCIYLLYFFRKGKKHIMKFRTYSNHP